MEFKEIQKEILETAKRYEKKYGLDLDKNTSIIKLFEEVGEFAEAALIHRKKSRPEKHLPHEKSSKKVAEELADIVGMTIINASHFGVDLEEAIKNKWIGRHK